MTQPHDLSRFVTAQKSDYTIAEQELLAGQKRSHWMWYIFPQMRGLGHSSMSHHYGIASLEEARAYLSHPLLGARLRRLTQILIQQSERNPERIFGSVDALKLRSSLTLFDMVEPNRDFATLLDKFFRGERDNRTLAIVRAQTPSDKG